MKRSKRNIREFVAVMVFIVSIIYSPASCFAVEKPSHPNRDEIRKLDDGACSGAFSFTVIGDSHGSTTVFEGIIDEIIKRKPAFSFSIGDFTNDGKYSEYSQFLGQIDRAHVPWFTVPGNHEYRSPEGHTSAKGKKRYKKIFGKQDFFFDYCGWRFIGLDVVAYDQLLPAQLNNVEKAVKGRDGKVAVFMHYPPAVIPHWEEGYWKSTAGRFMKILEENGVKLFFSGHIHMYDRLDLGPTTYIVTGGGGGTLDEKTPDQLNSKDGGGFYHFMHVKINGMNAEAIVVRPDLSKYSSE